jgi:hypothetical protein
MFSSRSVGAVRQKPQVPPSAGEPRFASPYKSSADSIIVFRLSSYFGPHGRRLYFCVRKRHVMPAN